MLEMTTAQANKEDPNVNVASADADFESNYHDAFRSTSADAANMRRLGKDQQLVRRFRVLSMASFVAVATAAWEFTVFNISQGLTNGGVPMLVYAIMWNFVGFCPIYLSMAEMASMAPIAGAQYHWVSEFAPESMQRGLSYLTGYAASLSFPASGTNPLVLAGRQLLRGRQETLKASSSLEPSFKSLFPSTTILTHSPNGKLHSLP
jgi:choline transport protein